jgi:MFS transporter, OPA family, solute carrier family 37 (glycerol-3-phosphate transporter), member 3
VIDLGAMFGSMALGYLSDLMYGKRSPVALGAVLFSIVISYVVTFNVYDMPSPLFFVLMFLLGFFISGLNNMISSACSADLGKQEALKGNARAISTVTGIIDGTGTLGSAAGQFIVGITQANYGWQNGYWLIIAIDCTITVIPILKIVYEEFKEIVKIKKSKLAMGLNSPKI